MAGSQIPSLAVGLLLAMTVPIGGCGGPSGPEPPPLQPNSAISDRPPAVSSNDHPPADSVDQRNPPGPTDAHPPTGGDGSIARIDENGRKWLGDIPYDVWFDDPLSLIAEDDSAVPEQNSATTAASPQTQEPAADGDTTTTPGTTASESNTLPPAVAAPDWPTLIAIDVLADEVKQIHNRMAAAARSVAQFNRVHEALVVDGATLAVLGAIADAHPGDLRWKQNAGYVRETGVRIAESAQSPGKESFDATRTAFDDLGTILNGSTPAGAEPAPRPDFAEFADRGLLMKRMETAFEWLRKNANTAELLAGQSEAAAHEASLLAALGAVVSTKGYSLADEADYATHAAGLTESAAMAAGAAKEPKFAEFSAALAKVQNTCTRCHATYRFGE